MYMQAFITTLIASFLGSGVFVAAYTAWRSGVENRIARRAEYLSRQIQNLYGPVNNLCDMTNGLRTRAQQVQNAGDAEFQERPRLNDDDLQKMEKIVSGYARRMRDNNREIALLISSNYPLVEIEDLPKFHQFQLNLALNQDEWLPNGSTFPAGVYNRLAPVDYSTPGFSDQVHFRYVELSRELAELRDHHPQWPEWCVNKYERVVAWFSRLFK
jgi:hypothetical protein